MQNIVLNSLLGPLFSVLVLVLVYSFFRWGKIVLSSIDEANNKIDALEVGELAMLVSSLDEVNNKIDALKMGDELAMLVSSLDEVKSEELAMLISSIDEANNKIDELKKHNKLFSITQNKTVTIHGKVTSKPKLKNASQGVRFWLCDRTNAEIFVKSGLVIALSLKLGMVLTITGVLAGDNVKSGRRVMYVLAYEIEIHEDLQNNITEETRPKSYSVPL